MTDSLRQFKTEIFQALANPTRIAILDELRAGELTVGAMVRRLSIDQSNASQHLAILRARQIVVARKIRQSGVLLHSRSPHLSGARPDAALFPKSRD